MPYVSAQAASGGSAHDSTESWDFRLSSVEREVKQLMWSESADLAPDPNLSEVVELINMARCHLARRNHPDWFWSFCSEQCGDEFEYVGSPDAEDGDDGAVDSSDDDLCCGATVAFTPPIYFVEVLVEDA